MISDLCNLDQAAVGVSSSYDALVELFECIANFLKRLRIYTDLPLTTSMTGIIGKIMAELLSVFALATKQIKQGRFSEWIIIFNRRFLNIGIEKFAKKLLGESEIEAVLRRLDRLTQEEGRMTVAETFEVVHGLVSNVKVVMNGTQILLVWIMTFSWEIVLVDGKASTDGVLKALGMLLPRSEIHVAQAHHDDRWDSADSE